MAASGSTSTLLQEEDWDDYLHGMFKKLKVDPEQLKEKNNSTALSKKNSRWYNQTIKTPKKTRKSLAVRSSRNRLSPYRSFLTCPSGKIPCSPLIWSSSLNSTVECGSGSDFGKTSNFGKINRKISRDFDVCSCNRKAVGCHCACKVDGTTCKCRHEMKNCRFGSVCKSKLLTFQTLATIIEESSEGGTKEKSEDKKLDGPVSSNRKNASVARKKELDGAAVCAATSDVPCFTNYRSNITSANNSSPKRPLSASQHLSGAPVATRSSNQVIGHASSRVPARPEYSCSQEARMAIDSVPDDTSVDDLAGYFDSIVYIPRKMSAMAEMMYT